MSAGLAAHGGADDRLGIGDDAARGRVALDVQEGAAGIRQLLVNGVCPRGALPERAYRFESELVLHARQNGGAGRGLRGI